MSKFILVILVTTLLASCSSEQKKEVKAETRKCVHQEIKIISTNVLGKSGNDTSQSIGAAVGAEGGAFVGCVVGGPVGCVIGAAVGAVSGAGLGTFDKSIDYEAHTASGTFICQGEECENLEEKKFTKSGNILKSNYCFYE